MLAHEICYKEPDKPTLMVMRVTDVGPPFVPPVARARAKPKAKAGALQHLLSTVLREDEPRAAEAPDVLADERSSGSDCAGSLDSDGRAFELLDGLDPDMADDIVDGVLSDESITEVTPSDGRGCEIHVDDDDDESPVEETPPREVSVDELVRCTAIGPDGRFTCSVAGYDARVLGKFSYFPMIAPLARQRVACRCNTHAGGGVCNLVRNRRDWPDERMLRWFYAGFGCADRAAHNAKSAEV